MPEDAEPSNPPQAAPSPAVVCSGTPRQRDPPIFSGTDDQDVDDWLSTYDRVSVHNKWNDVDKLSYVLFYLSGVASLWFRNHESDCSTWAQFRTRFQEVFGRPAVRKLKAEQQLRGRAQQKGENFTSYIEDVVDLCRRINPSMTEDEKVKNVMKGIEDDAFQMLLARNPRTVTDIIALCQSYEELRKQRISTRRALSTDGAISSLTDSNIAATSNPPLFDQIKQFIREEVARQLSLLPTAQASESTLSPELRQVIHDQVADVVPLVQQPPPVTAPLTYAAVAARQRPFSAPAQYAPTSAFSSTPPAAVNYTPAGSYYPPPQPLHLARPAVRAFNPWRTQDNKPICFSCGIAGHVARFCRRRPWYPSDSARPQNSGVGFPYHPAAAAPRFDASPPPSRASRRSPSPRRRSLSPLIRRPEAVQEEN